MYFISLFFFFFFKQKTAYEITTGDWSSDVCSSDLEFAHSAKAFGVRPITGAEVTLTDGSHVTLLVENARGYANLCRLLTAAHAGTRPQEGADPLPPSLDAALLAELNDGLACLSGCARHGLGLR